MFVHDWHRQVDLGRLFIHDWQAYCVWKNRDRVDPGDANPAQPMNVILLWRHPCNIMIKRSKFVLEINTAVKSQPLIVFFFIFIGKQRRGHQEMSAFSTYETSSCKTAVKHVEKVCNEATWRCCEPTCLSLGSLFDLDQCDLWPWY